MASEPEFYEVELTGFAYGGDCLGRLADGRAVFVPFCLPGERARIRLVEERRSYAHAELVDILQPSSRRISALCPHFGVCGGCHYQHMPYADQLSAKSAILEDQLARIGGLADIPLKAAVPSPAEFNYRNHVQFHLSPSGKLGFRRAHSSEGLDIQECHLPEAEINEIWPQIEFDGPPELDRVGLRSGQGGEVQLILESEQPDAPEFSVELLPISAVHLSPAGTLVLAGQDYLLIEVNRRAFKVSAGSFFQVNTAVAGRMVDYLLESLPLSSEVTVLDAYCGVGLFSAFLAERAGRLIAVESSASAAEDFTVNLDEFDHVELYEAEVEQVLLQPARASGRPGRRSTPRRAGAAGAGWHTAAAPACNGLHLM